MKFLAVVLALVCTGAGADPRKPQPQPVPALRQVVEQYDTVRKVPQPRELSPAERAELRRQVSEYGQRGRRN
ncbi:MAG TPA: hypothetical protein VF522_10660 [Ramlibacter sp.]|uniref:hypothetical protein n=1 Tax=Ramlibacter sp. TaxID=1917967 RepID=UPI002ED4D456